MDRDGTGSVMMWRCARSHFDRMSLAPSTDSSEWAMVPPGATAVPEPEQADLARCHRAFRESVGGSAFGNCRRSSGSRHPRLPRRAGCPGFRDRAAARCGALHGHSRVLASLEPQSLPEKTPLEIRELELRKLRLLTESLL